jgi:AraC-like DNA-binding protein
VSYAVLSMVDCVLLFVTFVGMLFAMLQDRRRPMWPALAAMLPFVLLGTSYIVFSNSLLVKMASIYLLMLGLAFTGYMVYAIRQYERWLNNNYADLEHKEVWQSLTVSLACMLMFILYVFADDMTLIWLVHFVELVLVGLLLWRVETLSSLTPSSEGSDQLESLEDIGLLLQQRCEDTQLYLQHDLTLGQLAHALGTNRTYLSQYFARQDTTYNGYIHTLRIRHCVRVYHEAAATGRPVTAQELATESGYRNYKTFSLAFRQRMHQSITAWMNAGGQ